MEAMIPFLLMAATLAGSGSADATAPPPATAAAALPAAAPATPGCLPGGDGYFRARLAGALQADIDWPDAGTDCEGEAHGEIPLAAASGATRDQPPKDSPAAANVPAGVRLSFRRSVATTPNLLFVFGISGVREGEPLQAAGANLTIIVQGTSRIYSTRGDARCTVDSLTQRALAAAHRYRLEVRGFCTQPAHEVRGSGEILVSRFDFAGSVNFAAGEAAP
jgi:hypothetical protein